MKRLLLLLCSVLVLAACGNAGVSGDKFVGHWVNASKRWIAVDIEKFGDRYKVTHVDMSNGASGGYVASFEKGALVAQKRYDIYLDPKTDTIELNHYGRFKRAPAPDKDSKTEWTNLVELDKDKARTIYIDSDIRVDSNGVKHLWLVTDAREPVPHHEDKVPYLSSRQYGQVSCTNSLIGSNYAEYFSKNRMEGDIVLRKDYSANKMVAPRPGLNSLIFKRVCGAS